MFRRFISLILILGCMAWIVYGHPFKIVGGLSPILVLGFMLLAAYCIGFILEQMGLPRITGYLFAGLLLGPCILNFYSKEAVLNLGFLNNLALAFISFSAGGELKLSHLRKRIKSILYLTTGMTIIAFFGVTLVVYAIAGFIPFMKVLSPTVRMGVAGIFGVIAIARSPSSTIALISETKAEGDYTDTVLSVTIAKDVVVLIVFAIVISICEVLISGGSFSSIFIVELSIEILLAFVLGFLLGKIMIFLIEKLKVEFPIVITAMGFFVIKFSHYLGDYLQAIHEINFNLEPLLICMAAGFTVQNASKHGNEFLERMDKVSLPIYICFFAITGANIDLAVLKTAWFLGLVVVVVRIATIYVGCFVSGKLAGDPPKIYHNTWFGFITQAGVSLGLVAEVVRRFPSLGLPIQTVLIAAITMNQIIGPIAFKYALYKTGDAKIIKK